MAIKGVVGERRGLLQQSRSVPVVMLDEAVREIHSRCPRLARQKQAARRVKVDAVGCGKSEVARLVSEPAWRHAVSSGECARERFDRVVASLEAGVGDAEAAAESPRGALQQETAPKRRRCLANAGAHQAVEVKRAEHRPRRQCPPVEALVESFDHGINDVAQAIRVRLHAPEYAPRRADAHDRICCDDLRQITFDATNAFFM